MAKISAVGSKGHHTFTLNVWEVEGSTDITNNTTDVGYSFTMYGGNWAFDWNSPRISYSITIGNKTISGDFGKYGGGETLTISSNNSISIKHDDNGSKTIDISFTITDNINQYYTTGDCSASGSMKLTDIPRYANITSYTLTAIDETTVQIDSNADSDCDLLQYKLGAGEWKDGPYYKSTVSGLSANTTYGITIRLRRRDSQLWTESEQKTVTTYDYPHCTATPDFTIGDMLTLSFYNPLSRSITVRIIGNDESEVDVYENLTGTTLSGYNAEHTIINLYNSIRNSQSGVYKVKTEWNGQSRTTANGNKYSIRGNEIPVINGIDYKDELNIAGDNKLIVQNKSNLAVGFGQADAVWGAYILHYKIECNGKTYEGLKSDQFNSLGTVDSSRDVDLSLIVTDSRGMTATKTIKIKMLEYSNPDAVVTLQRLNNYEDETYFTVDASISSVNGKNTCKIIYRMQTPNEEPSPWMDIENRKTETRQLDKNKVWVFTVKVTDAFGGIFEDEYTLQKGVFPLFIDIEKQSVSINKFPVYDKSLEAGGLISVGERTAIELEAGESIDIPVWLALCTGLVNFRIAGANLEIARLFYVFRSNQYFGLHKTLIDESYNNTSTVVPMEMRNTEQGYTFKITNNHSSPIFIRYGILELC